MQELCWKPVVNFIFWSYGGLKEMCNYTGNFLEQGGAVQGIISCSQYITFSYMTHHI